MNEEERAPEEILEEMADVTEETVPEETVKEDSIEDKARAKGWRPKEDLKNKDDFVDAKEFLAREPIFNHMKEVKEQLKAVVGYNQKLEKKINEAEVRGYQNAIKELELQKKIAESNEDDRLIEDIDKQIVEHNNAIIQQQQANIPHEAAAFLHKHERVFQEDRNKLNLAIEIAKVIRMRNPGILEKDVFKELENQMSVELGLDKKEPAVKKEKINPVAPPTKGNVHTSKETFSIHDLSAEAQNIFRGIASIKKAAGEDFTVTEFVNKAKETYSEDGLLRGK